MSNDFAECEYCGLEIAPDLLGSKPDKIPSSTAENNATNIWGPYTGHYAECLKMPLLCIHFSEGCPHSFLREYSEDHHVEFSQKHVALLANNLKLQGRVPSDGWIDLSVALQFPVLDQERHDSDDATSTFHLKGSTLAVQDGLSVRVEVNAIDDGDAIHAQIYVIHDDSRRVLAVRCTNFVLWDDESVLARSTFPTKVLEDEDSVATENGQGDEHEASIGGPLLRYASDEPGFKPNNETAASKNGEITSRLVTVQDLLKWSQSGKCRLCVWTSLGTKNKNKPTEQGRILLESGVAEA